MISKFNRTIIARVGAVGRRKFITALADEENPYEARVGKTTQKGIWIVEIKTFDKYEDYFSKFLKNL